MNTISRLCVQWPSLGPVHFSRLEGAYEVLSEEGIELVALETASKTQAYEWQQDTTPRPYRRMTVFEGENYDSILSERMHVGITTALDSIQPDGVLIHSYSTPDARAALQWCRVNRKIAICMAESRRADASRNWAREKFKAQLVSQFDSALASGRASADYIEELGVPRDKIFIGYSVVDNDYFARKADAVRAKRTHANDLPGLNDETPFFLASARFMPRKDLDILLKAYSSYRSSANNPWRLVLIGDGELRDELESIIVHEEIEEVSLPGWRHLDELPVYYGYASAFVHTAQTDQWGLVVNEALASGLPVIVSTGTGAAAELIEEGVNGFTFPVGATEVLAQLMHRVAHDSDLDKMSASARESVHEWAPRRFGTSLLDAALAGAHASNQRGLSLSARILILVLRKMSRSPRAFHAIQD